MAQIPKAISRWIAAWMAENGGGGGGSVATDAIFDAKGDLPAGTGANTAAKRTVGTNGQFLKADSGQATGLVWATPTTADFADSADRRYVSDAQEAKIDYLTVTQAVDLDAMETLLAGLDAAIVLKGSWDASAGTFPGSGAAQAGWSYIVTVGGTVDSVVFNVGDRIIAILDNASTSTFASNWFKSDYTDLVSSVNNQTGAVTLLVSEVDSDNTLPANCALGSLRTTQDGRFWHGSATDVHDQILKASNFAVRATTGTSETIASTDDKKIVTFTNASAIAVSLAQAGSGSPAVFTNGWSVRLVNLGPSTVTITPTTSTIGGASTLQLGPGQGSDVNSDGTNYKCIIFDSLKIGIALGDETTAITTGTAKATFRMPCAMKLLAVRASVTTAPTGSTILIDINEGGTTVLSTKLMIDASEKTSTTAATPAVISDAVLADDAEITIDFDQVGSTIAGAGVKVWLIGIPG